MKAVSSIFAAVVLASISVGSFAQGNGPLTRAQVKAELADLESVGYRPVGEDPYYPDDIQAAEARLAAKRAAAQQNPATHP